MIISSIHNKTDYLTNRLKTEGKTSKNYPHSFSQVVIDKAIIGATVGAQEGITLGAGIGYAGAIGAGAYTGYLLGSSFGLPGQIVGALTGIGLAALEERTLHATTTATALAGLLAGTIIGAGIGATTGAIKQATSHDK